MERKPETTRTAASPSPERLLIGLATAFFLLGVSLKLRAPLTYWDSALLEWALDPAPSPAPAGTSPFFLILLKALASLGWLEVVLLRWVQAGGAVLSGIAAHLLAFRLWKSPRAACLAYCLYLLHPAVVQGAHSLDMADASYYPAFVSFWLLAFIAPGPGGWRRSLRLAGWGALAMGWKTTSSLGLLLFAFPAVWRGIRGPNGGWRDFFSTCAGIALFSALWWPLQGWETVQDSAGIAAESLMTTRPLAATAFHLVMGVAWWGPFLAGLGAGGALTLLPGGTPRIRPLIRGTVLYLVGYWIVGGMNYGFPRYHLAVLPLLCGLAANPSWIPRPEARSLGAILLLVLPFAIWAPDPVLALNAGLREAFVHQRVGQALGGMLPGWAAWAGLAAGIGWALRIPWAKLLVLLALANILGLGVSQGRAFYSTSYGYGEEGREETLQWLARNVPRGHALLSPPNLGPELRRLGFRGAGHGAWKTRESILGFLRRERPAAVLLGSTENSVWQLLWLLRQPPAELEACRDRFLRRGSYWICRLGQPQDARPPAPG